MDYKSEYEAMVKRCRELHESGNALTKQQMEIVCPQLKESEDERIKKDIRLVIESSATKYMKETGNMPEWYDRIVAWLEKRKEPEPGDEDRYMEGYMNGMNDALKEQKPAEHLELKAGHWYICHRAYCCRADHLTVKEGERFQCEKDGIVKGFVIKEPEKYFKECSAPAPMEDEQKEQNAEWSEEDESMLVNIITGLEMSRDSVSSESLVALYNKKIDWLKSLRPQQKQEWSEEDERKIIELKTFIAQCNGFNKENRKKAFDMIDALHPRSSWKPSEE